MAAYETILVETHGKVGLIRFNRPQVLNALCDAMMAEIGAQLLAFDADPAIGAIVLTGSEKAFAAGADIKEMQGRTYPAAYQEDFISRWETILQVKTPVIAAVAGFALGGGCELAMMCDMILTARMMDAAEAERANLVSRVFPADQLVTEAIKIAERIANQSPVAVSMAAGNSQPVSWTSSPSAVCPP